MTQFIDNRNRVQVKVRKRPKPKQQYPGVYGPPNQIARLYLGGLLNKRR